MTKLPPSSSPHLQDPETRPIRALVFLFGANIISGFSQGVTMLSIPWFLVREFSDGKFLNSTMVGTITLLSLFWGVFAGTLIDRYNRKHIFMTLTLTDGVILVSVALCSMYFQTLPFIMIAGIYCLTVFTYNVHYPNLYAFVQELFEPKYYARVNSALEIQGQTTAFIGMMVAGLLLSDSADIPFLPDSWTFEAWSLNEIFLLDGMTYFLAFILISQIPYRPAKSKQVDKGNVWLRLRQGFEYLNTHRLILIFGIASYLMFFSILVLIQVAMPVYVHDYLEAKAFVLASFKGMYALGAISAGLMGLSFIVKRGHAIRQIIFLLGLGAALYVVLATTRSVVITLIAAYLLGISNAGIRILRITYLVRLVPNRVIGRVNSFFMVLNVLMRFSMIMVLALPFFSDPENGKHIVYGFGILSVVISVGLLTLIHYFPKFDQKAARNAEE